MALTGAAVGWAASPGLRRHAMAGRDHPADPGREQSRVRGSAIVVQHSPGAAAAQSGQSRTDAGSMEGPAKKYRQWEHCRLTLPGGGSQG
jgi:hypothetical protein